MARPKKSTPAKAAAAAVDTVKETVAKVTPKAKSPAKAKMNTYLQFGASQWDISDCKERVMSEIAAQGHKKSEVKTLAIYVKPEEGKVYYVANEEITGSIGL